MGDRLSIYLGGKGKGLEQGSMWVWVSLRGVEKHIISWELEATKSDMLMYE